MRMFRARAAREDPHDVPARDGADQASIPGHDRDDSLSGDLTHHPVEGGSRLDGAGREIEEAGNRLAGMRGGQFRR